MEKSTYVPAAGERSLQAGQNDFTFRPTEAYRKLVSSGDFRALAPTHFSLIDTFLEYGGPTGVKDSYVGRVSGNLGVSPRTPPDTFLLDGTGNHLTEIPGALPDLNERTVSVTSEGTVSVSDITSIDRTKDDGAALCRLLGIPLDGDQEVVWDRMFSASTLRGAYSGRMYVMSLPQGDWQWVKGSSLCLRTAKGEMFTTYLSGLLYAEDMDALPTDPSEILQSFPHRISLLYGKSLKGSDGYVSGSWDESENHFTAVKSAASLQDDVRGILYQDLGLLLLFGDAYDMVGEGGVSVRYVGQSSVQSCRLVWNPSVNGYVTSGNPSYEGGRLFYHTIGLHNEEGTLIMRGTSEGVPIFQDRKGLSGNLVGCCVSL